jgi:hypothetical protein
MDRKTLHLQIIQGVINRMASNSFLSFLIKGWCVTIVSALIALGAKDGSKRLFVVAYYPLVMFWVLDSYFLWQESLFRGLYDLVRQKEEESVDFSMNTALLAVDAPGWVKTARSKTVLLFDGTMIGAVLISLLIIAFLSMVLEVEHTRMAHPAYRLKDRALPIDIASTSQGTWEMNPDPCPGVEPICVLSPL